MQSRTVVVLSPLITLALALAPTERAAAMHAGRRCITCERVADAASAPRMVPPVVVTPRAVRRDAARRGDAVAPRRPSCPAAAASATPR